MIARTGGGTVSNSHFSQPYRMPTDLNGQVERQQPDAAPESERPRHEVAADGPGRRPSAAMPGGARCRIEDRAPLRCSRSSPSLRVVRGRRAEYAPVTCAGRLAPVRSRGGHGRSRNRWADAGSEGRCSMPTRRPGSVVAPVIAMTAAMALVGCSATTGGASPAASTASATIAPSATVGASPAASPASKERSGV